MTTYANFVPAGNNNGQTLGTQEKRWTAGYIATVPEDDNAVINRKYVADNNNLMEEIELSGTTIELDVVHNKAYVCTDNLSNLTITSLPGKGNYSESSIWFTADSAGMTLAFSEDIEYTYVGSLNITAGSSYVMSIINNTIVLHQLTEVKGGGN